MATFKKMMLLSQEEVERIKAKQIKEYDPSLNLLARIKDQLDTVLSDPNLAKIPPDQRLKMLQQLQHRFDQVKHEGEMQIKLPGVASEVASTPEPVAPTPPPPLDQEPEQPTEPEILVSKRYKSHAKRLMKEILRDPGILAVNDRKEIVVNGQTVPDSNIIDLVSDVFTTSKARIRGSRPHGFQEFLSVLKDVNAPRSLLINPNYNPTFQPLPDPASLPSSPIHKKPKTHYLIGKPPTHRILSLYKV